MRLIDADLLKERFPQTTYYEYQDNKNSNKRICKIIDDAPTVVERKRGEWIYHGDWQSNGECPYECALCGIAYDYKMNFCGNCGADMRGNSNE